MRVRRAATVLLGVIVVMAAGCHRIGSKTLLPISDRALVYATVLEELRHESRAEWVVVDTLLPTDELDADLRDKVVTELPATRRMVDTFVDAQRVSSDQFRSVTLPAAYWTALSMQRLDSLRAAVRADVASGNTVRGARNDAFWQQWQRVFPGSAGYVILSPASIADDQQTALVHVRIACGSVCGETQLRMLRRESSGGWRTIRRLRLSES